MNGAVVFASKYGSTHEYAERLAAALGWSCLDTASAEAADIKHVDCLAVGGPIYGFGILPDLETFLVTYGELLTGKSLAAFVVCGDTVWNRRAGEGGWKNLEKLTRHLPQQPVAAAILGGRLNLDLLDKEDSFKITAFYRSLGREPSGFDRMDLAAVDLFAARIKTALAPA